MHSKLKSAATCQRPYGQHLSGGRLSFTPSLLLKKAENLGILNFFLTGIGFEVYADLPGGIQDVRRPTLRPLGSEVHLDSVPAYVPT